MATHSSSLAWKIPWVEEPGKKKKKNIKTSHGLAVSISCKNTADVGVKEKKEAGEL